MFLIIIIGQKLYMDDASLWGAFDKIKLEFRKRFWIKIS